MSRPDWTLALGALTLFSGLSALAAEPVEKPVLVGPAWKVPVAPIAWTVTPKSVPQPAVKGASALPVSPAQKIASASILLAPKFQKEVVQFQSGDPIEVWFVGPNTFVSTPSGSTAKITIADPGMGGSMPDLSELAWVKPELFRGPFVMNGENCLIFATGDEPEPAPAPIPGAKAANTLGASKANAQKWPVGPIAGLPLKPGMQVAAIDEKTRLPKYVQFGTELTQYEFRVPTPEELELPAKVKKAGSLSAPAKIRPLPLP